jgi:hypothetical protein
MTLIAASAANIDGSPHSQRPDIALRSGETVLSAGRKAVFWNFALQDMLSALFNSTSTRLDIFDLAIWQSAGIKLSHEGYVYPSNSSHPNFDPDKSMEDDMICNALIWLLAKLVNFIEAGDDVPQTISPLGLGMPQKELLGYWETHNAQFNAWYDGLLNSCHPAAVTSVDVETGMKGLWFAMPMCESAMQWWYFARIQLLHRSNHRYHGLA